MSPSLQIDGDALKKVAAAIYEEVQGREIVEKLHALKAEFDWNPFNEDGDEFVGLWAEVKHNFQLVGDTVMTVVSCAERAVVAGQGLSDPQKHAACVQVLDDIFRLPWYMEPFDGIVFDMAVSAAVAALNSVKFLQGTETLGGTIDLTAKVAAADIARIEAAKARVVEKFREIG